MTDAWQRLRKHRLAFLSMIILYFIVLACVLVPWLMEMVFKIKFDEGIESDANLAPPLAAWFGVQRVAGWIHLFGTDGNGRDLLVRTLKGGQLSLSIGMAALFISTTIGVPYGTTSAYFGGQTDNVMMRFVDLIYSMPYMILVILLITFIGKQVDGDARIFLLFVAIGFVSWLTLARITRGQVLSIMKKEYVEAARAIGTPAWQIIARHLIPNAIGPIVVYATRLAAVIILEEAFLSFLGFGASDPMSSWGTLIRDGIKDRAYWWLPLFPGLFLFITLFALSYFGDGLRDALDPTIRGVKQEAKNNEQGEG